MQLHSASGLAGPLSPWGPSFSRGRDWASSYGHGKIPRGKHQCTCTYQATTVLPLADISLVKASHMTNSSLLLSGVNTGRHVALGAIFKTIYYTRLPVTESLLLLGTEISQILCHLILCHLTYNLGRLVLLAPFTDMTKAE